MQRKLCLAAWVFTSPGGGGGTYPVELAEARERVLPLGLEVEARGAEGVRLLLHRLAHHAPEPVRHRHAQVLCRHLTRLQHALPDKTTQVTATSQQHTRQLSAASLVENFVRKPS